MQIQARFGFSLLLSGKSKLNREIFFGYCGGSIAYLSWEAASVNDEVHLQPVLSLSVSTGPCQIPLWRCHTFWPLVFFCSLGHVIMFYVVVNLEKNYNTNFLSNSPKSNRKFVEGIDIKIIIIFNRTNPSFCIVLYEIFCLGPQTSHTVHLGKDF